MIVQSLCAADGRVHASGSAHLVTQVSEDRLISILEQVNEQAGASKPRVTIQRRRAWDDD